VFRRMTRLVFLALGISSLVSVRMTSFRVMTSWARTSRGSAKSIKNRFFMRLEECFGDFFDVVGAAHGVVMQNGHSCNHKLFGLLYAPFDTDLVYGFVVGAGLDCGD
jgi:hypothetical protein